MVVVGVARFFRREMFTLSFLPGHNGFHLLSGVVALCAGLGSNAARAAPLRSQFCVDFDAAGQGTGLAGRRLCLITIPSLAALR